LGTSIEREKEKEEAPKARTTLKTQEYIICFICEVQNDEGFALFKNDMDIFSEKLKKSLIDVKVHNRPVELLKDHLAGWYSYNIDYVNRCIDMLKDKLAIILHTSLIGKPVIIIKRPSQSTLVEDLTRFVKAAALNSSSSSSQIPQNQRSQEQIGKSSSQVPSIQVTIIEDSSNTSLKTSASSSGKLIISVDSQYVLHLNSTETNIFCREWAKELKSAGRDPLLLRKSIEHHKFKVVQELNHLRRLIDQAKMNNYALYKTYRFLRASNNSDVLLSLLIQESANDANGSEVLDVIEKSLQSLPQGISAPGLSV